MSPGFFTASQADGTQLRVHQPALHPLKPACRRAFCTRRARASSRSLFRTPAHQRSSNRPRPPTVREKAPPVQAAAKALRTGAESSTSPKKARVRCRFSGRVKVPCPWRRRASTASSSTARAAGEKRMATNKRMFFPPLFVSALYFILAWCYNGCNVFNAGACL